MPWWICYYCFCSHIQSLVELESVIEVTAPYFEHTAPLTYSLCFAIVPGYVVFVTFMYLGFEKEGKSCTWLWDCVHKDFQCQRIIHHEIDSKDPSQKTFICVLYDVLLRVQWILNVVKI